MNKKLGIIGGLGPMATVKFIEILNNIIVDKNNIEYLVINDPTTPDRTKYILGNINENPLNNILSMVNKLDKYNVDMIVMPCNTASYFYDKIIENTNTLFINIVEETVLYLKENNINKIGLLATTGSIKSGVYKHFCDKHGITCIIPNLKDQESIMSIIYDGVKSSKEINIGDLYDVSNNLISMGAEKIILGCTELSVLYQDKIIFGEEFVDSMQILARSVVKKIRK